MAGTTYLYLHEPAEALEAADRAVWLFDAGDPAQRFYGAEMIALIDAATAHVQAGEIEGAHEKLAAVLAPISHELLYARIDVVRRVVEDAVDQAVQTERQHHVGRTP